MSIQELVSKTLDQVRQDLFDRLTEKQAEYVVAGWLPVQLNLNKGIVRGLIELWAWGLYLLYQFLAVVLKQAFPDTATGVWLDLHCKQVGVTRKSASKAQHTIYFLRDASVGNVPIAAGRIVRTKPDGSGNVFRFVTLEAVVLPDGATEVAVTADAEEYGQGSNVTVGQICEIATVIPGVDGVENRAASLLSEGADKELDDPLRQRYVLAWQQLNGCTKHAYEAWARAVVGVVSAKVLDQHPRGQGTVDVVLKGTAGVPTEALIALVDVKINGTGNNDELAPMNDDVLVKGPTPVGVVIAAELELTGGDSIASLAEAEARARALFDSSSPVTGIAPLEVGQDCPLDLLRWALMGAANVKKINFTTPAADVAVAVDELAVLTSIALTFVWASEA